MTTTKTKVRRAAHSTKKTVAQNPASTTALVGAIVTLLGAQYGWSSETQVAVATFALFLAPFVRIVSKWYGDWRANKALAEADAEAGT